MEDICEMGATVCSPYPRRLESLQHWMDAFSLFNIFDITSVFRYFYRLSHDFEFKLE